LLFENYPTSALTTENRHLTTQKSTVTGKEIRGYCFDEDRDAVWFEGTELSAITKLSSGDETSPIANVLLCGRALFVFVTAQRV
jgi:hypothetical protein